MITLVYSSTTGIKVAAANHACFDCSSQCPFVTFTSQGNMRFVCIIGALLFLSNVSCFPNVYGKIKSENCSGDAGQPLILTPLLRQGKFKEAQTAAEVYFDGFKHIRSYAGYFTVNDQFNSNMFFWFFPSETDYANAPVILWLQGGPGATSLIGLFTENGPFVVKSKHGLKLRKYSWIQGHSVIYLDNPVGTGYSFTTGGYAQNETVIGAELYEALLQFFQLFPDLQKNDFFITGESYAGKYVPAISYTIYKNNPSAKQKINLQGLAMGNGLSDPENQLKYGDYLYQIGLIDINTKTKVQQLEQQAVDCIHNKQWAKANDIFDSIVGGGASSLFQNVTGFNNHFNYLVVNDTSTDHMGKYIQREDIKAAIHVGNTKFSDGDDVAKNLAEDVMQSVAPWISELLSHYRVLIYNGQLDIIVAYPLTINYLKVLNFNGADVYKTADRHLWHVNGELAGYVKQAGNLTEVLVRNAGHMVPGDQPLWALDLISRFTHNKPLY